MTSLSVTLFDGFTSSSLSLPLIRSGNDHGDESLRTESVILSLYVGYSLKEWDIFFMRKHIKWTKNSLNHEMLMLLRREILLSGKY